MIAQELEVSLHMAFVEARQARHEFITVEHLLLALLDNPSAAEVLRACACNIEELRKSLQNRLTYPPHSIRNEFESPGFVKTLGRFDKTQVSFIDQVAKREPLVLILLRH